MKFKIGEFSKINRITVKTLRHYEEIGLFYPIEIDDITGYRRYSTDQISLITKILAFKKMGFTLDEIKDMIKGSIDILRISEKLKELSLEKQMLESKIRELALFQKQIKGDCNMEDVKIKSLPKVIVASMRIKLKSYNDLFHLCPEVMAPEMHRLGCVCRQPAYCFNIYHDNEYRETDIDVEICEAVTKKLERTELLEFKEIEEVPLAACYKHKGAYELLGESYGKAFDYIEKNNLKVTGLVRESYIDGIWNKDNIEDWLTEIQIPVETV